MAPPPPSFSQNESSGKANTVGVGRKGGLAINPEQINGLLQSARSATLGTVDEHGQPHLVPIVFAYHNGHLYTAVDRKPKSTFRLKRLRNIGSNPQISVLVDHYSDEWTRLWWIRIDGTAQVIEAGTGFDRGIALLTEKYDAYATQPPPGPVIEVRIETVRAWSAS